MPIPTNCDECGKADAPETLLIQMRRIVVCDECIVAAVKTMAQLACHSPTLVGKKPIPTTESEGA